jgi:hypothetical protein
MHREIVPINSPHLNKHVNFRQKFFFGHCLPCLSSTFPEGLIRAFFFEQEYKSRIPALMTPTASLTAPSSLTIWLQKMNKTFAFSASLFTCIGSSQTH